MCVYTNLRVSFSDIDLTFDVVPFFFRYKRIHVHRTHDVRRLNQPSFQSNKQDWHHSSVIVVTVVAEVVSVTWREKEREIDPIEAIYILAQLLCVYVYITVHKQKQLLAPNSRICAAINSKPQCVCRENVVYTNTTVCHRFNDWFCVFFLVEFDSVVSFIDTLFDRIKWKPNQRLGSVQKLNFILFCRLYF